MPKGYYGGGRSYGGGGGRNHGGGGYSRSGVYTASGAPVRNVEAYAATGARTYTSAGRSISNPVAYTGAIEASVRQNTDSPKHLYHYTDSSSLSSIESSGRIKQSTDTVSDCKLGKGVYLTAKPPRASSDSLLQNNYASAGHKHSDKVEAYVRVDADKVSSRMGNMAGRNVHVVPGDLSLQDVGAKFGYR